MIPNTAAQLTEQLLQESIANKKRKPKGIHPPDAVGVKYLADLRKVIRVMDKDMRDKILPIVKRNEFEYVLDSKFTIDDWLSQLMNAFEFLRLKWTGANFAGIAQQIASTFVRSADRVNAKRNAKDFGVDIFTDSVELREYLAASTYDNARLIKSIPEQYLTNVESIVMSNVRAGGRWEAVAKQLKNEYGVTDRRAKLIARDQTAKVNGELNAKRQVAAGYEYFQWVDSSDNRVRHNHRVHNDKVTEYGKGIYKWSDPPIGEKGNKVPIIPGQEFQCRCIAKPISQQEVERNQRNNQVNWGVKR